MEHISIHNYEAYLLDYSEGNLTAGLQLELELFLMQHPELNIDLSDLAFTPVVTEKIAFEGKQNLKKTTSDLVSETQFISYIEHQLDAKQQQELEANCAANSSLAAELELYKQSVLVADATITYPDKASLKRQSKVIWLNFSVAQYAAAASVVLLVGLFALWISRTSPNGQPMMAAQFNKTNNIHKQASANTTNATDVQLQNNNNNINGGIASYAAPSASTLQTSNAVEQKNNAQNNYMATNNSDNVIKKDSVIKHPFPQIPAVNPDNKTLLADNSTQTSKTKTVVEVITENENEVTETTAKSKKGFWAFAGRTLKNLNTAGVKAVNGNETENKDHTSYALTIGGINITHKKNGKL